MRKSDDTARLGHIYDAICSIEGYVGRVDKAAFLTDIIWDTVQSDLPALKPMIAKLLGK